MLARLSLQLDTDQINFQKASVMQGVLLKSIDEEYAEKMHQQGYHPYSQYIEKGSTSSKWIINTLNEEAYNKIIMRLLEPHKVSISLPDSKNVL